MAKGKKRRRVPPPQEPAESEPGKPEKAGASAARTQRPGPRRLFPKPKSPAGRVGELVVIVALALGLALTIQAWIVKPYQIPSGSMEPTLDIGQRILANRFVYHFGDPDVGDIIVFHPPVGADRPGPEEMAQRAGTTLDLFCGVSRTRGEPCPMPIDEESSQNFIKRVVAGPGDTLSVRHGHPVVNGVEKTDEPYIRPCPSEPECNLTKTITVPPDHYFVMGDNRGNSFDSRFWGPVPRSWIIGKAFATYWPPNRLGVF